jgi:hypothetical protein
VAKHPIFFEEIPEEIVVLPIEPPTNEYEQPLQDGGVDHEPERLSAPNRGRPPTDPVMGHLRVAPTLINLLCRGHLREPFRRTGGSICGAVRPVKAGISQWETVPPEEKSGTFVAWVASVEETKRMKPTDEAIVRMASESPGRNAREPNGGLDKI